MTVAELSKILPFWELCILQAIKLGDYLGRIVNLVIEVYVFMNLLRSSKLFYKFSTLVLFVFQKLKFALYEEYQLFGIAYRHSTLKIIILYSNLFYK